MMKYNVNLKLILICFACLNAFWASGKSPTEMKDISAKVVNSKIKVFLIGFLKTQKSLPETNHRKEVIKYTDILIGLTDDSLESDDNFLHHPVDIYRFVRNHTVVYDHYVIKLKEALTEAKDETIEASIFDKMTQPFPSYEQYAYASTAILKLQEVYAISANDISRGKLFQNKLSAHECRDFSHAAFVTSRPYLTRQWILESLRLLTDEGDKTDTIEEVADNASIMMFANGNMQEALNFTMFIMENYPENEDANTLYGQIAFNMALAYDNITDAGRKEIDDIGHYPPKVSPHIEEYNKLCRQPGTNYSGSPMLICYYDMIYSTSGFNYQPMKVEILSPFYGIALIHNILSKQSIEEIKSKSKPKILKQWKPSASKPESLGVALDGIEIRNRNHNCIIYPPELEYISPNQFAQTVHVKLGHTDLSPIVRRNLEQIHGIRILDSHPLEVTNYAIGGDIEHSDSIYQVLQEVGERNIVRAMLFLSSPDEGGATIFPESGHTLYPETGSMLLWHEFKKEKTESSALTNSECPVIIGDKWTASFRTILHV